MSWARQRANAPTPFTCSMFLLQHQTWALASTAHASSRAPVAPAAVRGLTRVHVVRWLRGRRNPKVALSRGARRRTSVRPPQCISKEATRVSLEGASLPVVQLQSPDFYGV